MTTLNDIKQWYYTPETEIPKTLEIGCERMPDVRKTIQSLIQVLDAHSGERGYLPYFYQLNEIYLKLKT